MRPTRIRDKIMKKIMTFAILAFLLGGFSINANAQDGKQTGKNDSKQVVVNWEQKLTEFEQTVNDCVGLYEQMQDNEKFAKENQTKFNEGLSTAQSLQFELDQNKNQLSKKQGVRFNNACRSLKKICQK